ncbi:MAG: FtsL-like putative cell division protein [Rikenellaceae bacterium]|nr:FtsL-like putative cell division protein [Rikenellaceae bacterium]MCL2692336.1 FtsL-like putative cell division protein [Rikenellaceae bacterium]
MKRKKDTDLSDVAAERAPWEDPLEGDGFEDTNAEQPPSKTERKKKGWSVASVLTGSILSRSGVTRTYPFLVFVACLMFLYIANIFRTQYTYREYARLTEQVKELRAKSLTIASDKMRATRQSNIITELERRRIPLHESLTPNRVIPNPERGAE